MFYGIVTGGGDSPAINAAIRAIVRKSTEQGNQVMGFKNGWAGMVENEITPLVREDASGILPTGGSILGSSRTDPFARKDGPKKVKVAYQERCPDGLIVIGGDDTLGVAHKLHRRLDIKVVGIPQTIDNDVALTTFSIGALTAMNEIMSSLDKLHSTATTHHRVMILEVMGRDAGWLALMGGLAGGADIILVPERKFKISEIKRRIQRRKNVGKRFSIITVAEGATSPDIGGKVVQEEVEKDDEFEHARLGGVGDRIHEQLKDKLNMPIRVTRLAYLQRGGSPTFLDRVLATLYGEKAVELCNQNNFDKITAAHPDLLNIKAVDLQKVVDNSPRCIPDSLLKTKEPFW